MDYLPKSRICKFEFENPENSEKSYGILSKFYDPVPQNPTFKPPNTISQIRKTEEIKT